MTAITTIPASDRRLQYVASAGQTVFSYTFPVFSAAHLAVTRFRTGIETALTNGVDFTVTGAAQQEGGTIVLSAAALAGDIITILSAQPYQRSLSLQNGGDLPAATLVQQFNENTIADQQLASRLNRGMRVADSEAVMPVLPSVTMRANRLLAFDANGAPLTLLPTPPVVAPGTLTIDARAYVTMGATTDQSAGLQAAINAAAAGATASYGGLAQVDLPGGYLRLDNSVTIPSFVSVAGRGPQGTFIDLFAAATINLGTAAPAAATRCQALRGVFVSGANKTTSTYAISVQNAYAALLDRVTVDQAEKSILVAERCNTTVLSDVVVRLRIGAGAPVALHFRGGATNTDRSDVLHLRNVILEGNWTDNSVCLLWEGCAYTIDAVVLRGLHAVRGIHARQGSGNSALGLMPQFATFDNLQLEGFKLRAIQGDHFADIKILNADINNLSGDASQGNADAEAIACYGDTSGGFNRGFQISNARVGFCRQNAMYFDNRDVQISNVKCASASKAGSNSYAAVFLAANAQDIIISNLRGEEDGGPALVKAAVELGAGARRVLGVNINGREAVTASVIDASGRTDNLFLNLQEPGGAWRHARRFQIEDNVSATGLRMRISNTANTTNSAAGIEFATTGAANEFMTDQIIRSAGGTELVRSVGSGVLRQVHQAPVHRFNDLNAVTQFAVGQLLPSYANDAAAATGGIAVGGWYYNTTSSRECQRRV